MQDERQRYERKLSAWLQSTSFRDTMAARGKPKRPSIPELASTAPEKLRPKTIHDIAKENLQKQARETRQVWCSNASYSHKHKQTQKQKQKQKRERHKKRPFSNQSCEQSALQVKDYYRRERARKKKDSPNHKALIMTPTRQSAIKSNYCLAVTETCQQLQWQQLLCDGCGREFASKRSISIHMKHCQSWRDKIAEADATAVARNSMREGWT